MKQIHLLSGGAAQGLVTQLQVRFLAQSDCGVQGTFGAVGMMKDRLLAGEPCDVLILTDALIAQLVASGHVIAGSEHALGTVMTGIAVKAGEQAPDTGSPEALKAALLAARGIYFPDAAKSTAGIHFMKVLKTLGIDAELADRLRAFPNGATAMNEMAKSGEAGLIGCTQVTEILNTPGVVLTAMLPKAFELATVYTAGVPAQAVLREDAVAFIRMLAGEDAAPTRRACGFDTKA